MFTCKPNDKGCCHLIAACLSDVSSLGYGLRGSVLLRNNSIRKLGQTWSKWVSTMYWNTMEKCSINPVHIYSVRILSIHAVCSVSLKYKKRWERKSWRGGQVKGLVGYHQKHVQIKGKKTPSKNYPKKQPFPSQTIKNISDADTHLEKDWLYSHDLRRVSLLERWWNIDDVLVVFHNVLIFEAVLDHFLNSRRWSSSSRSTRVWLNIQHNTIEYNMTQYIQYNAVFI